MSKRGSSSNLKPKIGDINYQYPYQMRSLVLYLEAVGLLLFPLALCVWLYFFEFQFYLTTLLIIGAVGTGLMYLFFRLGREFFLLLTNIIGIFIIGAGIPLAFYWNDYDSSTVHISLFICIPLAIYIHYPFFNSDIRRLL